MHLKTILLVTGLLHLSSSIYAQKISLSGKDLKLDAVLRTVEQQTDFVVFGDKSLLNKSSNININAKDLELKDFLNKVFADQNLTYELRGKTIVLKAKATQSVARTTINSTISQQVQPIEGRIFSTTGESLSGVTIRVGKDESLIYSDKTGVFRLTTYDPKERINLSFVGYQNLSMEIASIIALPIGKQVNINGNQIEKKSDNQFIFKLTPQEKIVEEVVVTGIVERKKESFTGATTTFTGEELLAIGNTNVIQSLKTLDPSFLVVENANFGSDPNRLANIEIRGRSSFTPENLETSFGNNPNLPLFILDGFESDLRTITDLNIHRIARITILKDAASTALYGSRAANGVVVVETKQPLPGKIEVSYSGDFVVNAPFLNDYNLMNAAEKLEFERLSGQFKSRGLFNSHMLTEADYYRRLADVKSGVDTYWLNEPVRTGFTQGHNVTLTGGGQELRFNAGISYKNDQGVMKGSGRDTWRGSLALTYRKDKLNLTNQLFVNGYNSNESPYGSFSNFSRAVPYYKKQNENGDIPRYLNLFQNPDLAQGFGDSLANPLYVAKIGNRDDSHLFGFTNNLQINYDILNNLRISGALSISKSNLEQVIFRPAENPEFDNNIPAEKGEYRNNKTENSSYQSSLMLTYFNVFAEKHSVTANIRAEIQENKFNFIGFGATGFATFSNGNPNLASGYTPNGRPSGSVNIARRNNMLASVNYMFDSKYLFDFNYRYDGSTAFGSAKRYSPFWSTGIGWNIHNEESFMSKDVFNLLKLRASIGYTGNQQFNQTLSVNVYNQLAGQNIFGEIADLNGLGNPNLRWQRSQNISLGLDFGLLNNRLNGFINAYRNHSSPLVIPITQAPSSGVVTYTENAGALTYTGLEAKFNYGIIYKPEERVVWNVNFSLAHNKGEYTGFEGKLNNLNEAQRLSNSYSRYTDGYSPESIWAVQSAGIDPLTGKEVFIKNDGTQTFTYRAEDELVLGSTRPDLEGVIGTSVHYKGFTAGAYLRYSINGDMLNTALYNKVENLSNSQIRLYNLDKRALYDRWQKPGDIAAFKAITDHSYTPISSRFIQRQSYIAGESFNISYRFTTQAWLTRARLKGLTISGYTNDIFRWSTVRNERGLDYPFATSFSLNINATF